MQGWRERLLGVINKGRDHNERPDKDTGNSISGLGSDRWVLREQVLSNCLMNDHREQNRDCLSWFYSNLLVKAKWVCDAHQSEAGIWKASEADLIAYALWRVLPPSRGHSSCTPGVSQHIWRDHKHWFLLEATRGTHTISKIWGVRSSGQVCGLWRQTWVCIPMLSMTSFVILSKLLNL